MSQSADDQSASGRNESNPRSKWITIAIVAGVVVVLAGILIGLRNRQGVGTGEAAPTATAPTPPAAVARITIAEPVNGAVVDVASPFTVRGTGEGLPEGNVVVEALDAAGNVLAVQATTVASSDAGTGGAGPWSVQMTVDATPGLAGAIRASSPSPVDGSALASVSVAVTYGSAPSASPQITIDIPLQGEIISAQEVVVVGHASALPENNVVVRALGAGGETLSEQPATVAAELGGSGEWRATLQYAVTPGTPGNIFAFAPSPADGSVMAEASVAVQFGMEATAPAITIEQPVQGQIVDPGQFSVSGFATALPENNVIVRALDANGGLLTEVATTAVAELGGSGPWSAILSVDVASGTPGRIDALSTSPADGSIVAQSSIDVVYGIAETPQPAISINAPQAGETVEVTQITVDGVGTALPENNVIVRAIDAGGAILAEQPTTVDASLGGSGPWSVILSVDVAAGASGRIEAISTSPADGSIVAQTSVDVVYGRGRD